MSVGSNNKPLMQILQSFFFVCSFALTLLSTFHFACYQLEFYTFDNVIAHVRMSGLKGANQMIVYLIGMAHFMGGIIKILLHREICAIVFAHPTCLYIHI